MTPHWPDFHWFVKEQPLEPGTLVYQEPVVDVYFRSTKGGEFHLFVITGRGSDDWVALTTATGEWRNPHTTPLSNTTKTFCEAFAKLNA